MKNSLKKYTKYSLTIIILALSGCASGPNIETIRDWKIPENFNLVNGELDNGLEYSIYNSEKLPRDFVDLRLIVNVGSNDEIDAEFGYAHLVEHMVFRNTKGYPNGEVKVLLNRMGITLGHDYNAFTSSDHTFYQLRIPQGSDKNLEDAINVLKEISAHAVFKENDLEVEKKIVLEEKLLRLSESNSVDKKVKRKITEIIDKKYHLPIGNTDTLSKATTDSIQSFYDKWYQAGNMRLVIVGNLGKSEVTKTIISSFKAITSSNINYPKIKLENLENLKQNSFYFSSFGEDRHQDLVNFLHIKPRKNFSKFSEIEPLLAESLALDMFLAKLNLLANHRKLPSSYSVDAPGYFTDLDITRIIGFVRNGNYEELLKIHNAVTQNVLRNGFSVDEFIEFRKLFSERIGNQWYQFDALKADKIADIITSNVINGTKPLLISGSYYNSVFHLIDQISLEQVNLAFNMFNEQLRIISTEANDERLEALPSIAESRSIYEKSTLTKTNLNVADTVKTFNSGYEEINNTSANRIKIKSLIKDNALQLNTFELSNGYQVFHKQTKIDTDQFYIQLISPTGRLHSNDHKSLVNAYITSQLINTHRLGAFLGREYSEKLNASSEAPVILNYLDDYNHGLDIQAKKPYADFYFKLIKHLWAEPLNISEMWFSEMTSSLRQEMSDYRVTSANEYYSQYYKSIYSDHPGVWLPDDSAYEAFDLNDFKETIKNIFLTNDFYIMVVGDINEKEVTRLIESYLSDLPQYQYRTNEQVPLRIVKPTKSVKINVAASNEPKSFLELLYVNEKRYLKEQRTSVLVARKILYNRIEQKIREQQGLVYNFEMNSDLIRYNNTSDITKISFTTNLANKNDVESQIDAEIALLMNGDFTQGEVDQAKQVLKQDSLDWLTTNRGWAIAFSTSILRTGGHLGKSEKYMDPDTWLESVKVNDVKNAFNILFKNSVKIAAAYDPR